jgi:hypothetical protein
MHWSFYVSSAFLVLIVILTAIEGHFAKKRINNASAIAESNLYHIASVAERRVKARGGEVPAAISEIRRKTAPKT